MEEYQFMNVMILSVGTRCQLVKYFRQPDNGFDKVITTDCSKYAPALYFSDRHYIVPRITEKEYIPAILQICVKEKIDVLIPLQEDELELISENRVQFENLGILVVVSDIETVRTCRDKYCLYQKLEDTGLPCVLTYDYNSDLSNLPKHLELPVIIKERRGAGSQGLLKITNWPLLYCYGENVGEKLIVQPYIKAKEYGVDVYVDLISGEIVSIFAKEKLRMRAGETEKSKSYKNDKLFTLISSAVAAIPFRGPVDIDVFEYNDEYHILEINPRFGGGYPHAYECGVNFIHFIAKNAKGETNVPVIGQYEDNKILLKFTDVLLKDEKDLF